MQQRWSRRGFDRLGLVAALVVGSVVRFWGIGHDLPFTYDPDEPIFVSRAMGMLQRQSLDPGWYGAPGTTTIDALAVSYASFYAVGRLTGRFSGPEDFKNLYHADPTIFFLAGRLISAVLGIGMILLTYRIGHRVFTPSVALISAFAVALSPPVVGLSQNVRMDVTMATAVLAAFWFSLDILDTGRWKSYLFAGACTGLATVSKYPGLAVALVVFAAHCLRPGRGPREHTKLLASAAASLGAAFLAAPFLFLRFPSTLRDIQREARDSHLSHTGHGPVSNLGWYLFESLPQALTVWGVVLAIAGIVLCCLHGGRAARLVALFPLAFLFFISLLSLRWGRWALPAIPFLALCLAVPLGRAIDGAEQRTRAARVAWSLAGVLGAAIVLGDLVHRSFRQSRAMAAESTQAIARQWVITHVPRGSRIVLERYCPQLPRGMFVLFTVDKGQLREMDQADSTYVNSRPPGGAVGTLSDVSQLSRNGIEFMILSNFYERYAREGVGSVAGTYEKLLTRADLLYREDRAPGRNTGPTISVYRLAADATLAAESARP